VLVIVVGTAPWAPAARVRGHGDPSYGTYLYAWPVQQIIIAAGITAPLVVFGIAAPIALGLGYASWFVVERRAVRATHRVLRTQPRRAAR
jgi:peptidoglycan/LPS O-acetylase OafA/YrhL